jgi:CRISPR-associated endonuclease/helicase Cas3
LVSAFVERSILKGAEMTELTHRDFPQFFRAIWGVDPFPWQRDLLERLATGNDRRRNYVGEAGVWPDVLDLPTGSGKTAALDIAVFHLALEAARGSHRRAPLRVAFVVDRRLIVDDVFVRAKRLCEALGWSLLGDDAAKDLEARRPDLADNIRRVRADPVLKGAALQLRELAGPDQPPLIARSLRGGAPREDDWARTPVQPTILCSTVDQVGSRLLFRGYGVSDRMKPIHAGLLGSDCLILLDEAHLSEPFRQTLTAIEALRGPDEDIAPFGFAVLTATPTVDAKRPFGLSADDFSDPVLSARISASKPARLVEFASKKAAEAELQRAEEATREAKAMLEKMQAAEIARPAVAVVLNRVGRARAVFERLKAELNGVAKVILLIGPARGVDRDKNSERLQPIRTGQDELRREMSEPLIVVATQTIEAGVDIDFDGLVTEAAALDALRQRFGRLNRAGRPIRPQAVILAHKDDLGTKADDPIYGTRIKATWEKLQQLAAETDSIVDFGLRRLGERISREEGRGLAAPTADAPVLLPAYADLWSCTSPIPNADPEVALFLHGPDRSPATVQIVWRADIDQKNDLQPANERVTELARLIELFKLVPPRAAEAVEVPLWAARAWLDQTGANQVNFSDAVERGQEADGRRRPGRHAFRWAGEDSGRTEVVRSSALRNNDLIIVPADYGGCDQWGWNPTSNEPVIDVAEKAAWPYRARRFAVRMTPALITQEFRTELAVERPPTAASDAVARGLITIVAKLQEARATQLLDAVLDFDLPPSLKTNLQALTRARNRGLARIFSYEQMEGEAPRGVVFVASRGIEQADKDEPGTVLEHATEGPLAAVPATESDELAATSDRPVTLIAHCNDVRAWAEEFTVRAGLPGVLANDVAFAAFLHDPGKADPRFQTFLAGGDPYGPDTTELIAKSGFARLPPNAWQRAGLPENWRHEALSVRLAMHHPNFAKACDRALVLWLIGSHHGYGRPLFPHADPLDLAKRHLKLPDEFGGARVLEGTPGPQSLAFDFEGSDWAQLFELLKQKYGIWGLARLEAFVRLADHRASEEGALLQTTRLYTEAAK